MGSGIEFSAKETCELKGLPGRWALFSVDKPSALRLEEASGPETWSERLSALDRVQVWWARHFPGSVRLVMRMCQGRAAPSRSSNN